MPPDFAKELLTLQELQAIDKQIRSIHLELEQIPEQRQTQGVEYFSLAKVLQDKQIVLDNINKERLNLESQVQEGAVQLTDKERRLNAIKTPKEYQAAVKEVAQTRKENKDKEDRILKLMEEGEKINQEITQLKPLFADKESEFQKIDQTLNVRGEEIQALKRELEAKRPALFETIDPVVMKKYDTVRKRFQDPVAAIQRGVCQGCHMNIPAQLFNEMRKSAALRHCPNCQRLIFVGEA